MSSIVGIGFNTFMTRDSSKVQMTIELLSASSNVRHNTDVNSEQFFSLVVLREDLQIFASFAAPCGAVQSEPIFVRKL
jgi:hypothetical protein